MCTLLYQYKAGIRIERVEKHYNDTPHRSNTHSHHYDNSSHHNAENPHRTDET
ncbi:hypothetical protein ACFLSV_07800 [Bacteroidota bacterium]